MKVWRVMSIGNSTCFGRGSIKFGHKLGLGTKEKGIIEDAEERLEQLSGHAC